jgi:nitrogen fixation-related uncharacterized protein
MKDNKQLKELALFIGVAVLAFLIASYVFRNWGAWF